MLRQKTNVVNYSQFKGTIRKIRENFGKVCERNLNLFNLPMHTKDAKKK
jgi:hypothetical protein